VFGEMNTSPTMDEFGAINAPVDMVGTADSRLMMVLWRDVFSFMILF